MQRYVAHIDILGMSALVERSFDYAWMMLGELINIHAESLSAEYEYLDSKENIAVFKTIHSVVFSDTIVLFTESDTDVELKSLIVFVTELFNKALHRCIPIRAGIGLGVFRYDRAWSMYAGPALIDAYRVGESAQWLGIAFSEPAGLKAKSLSITGGYSSSPAIVDWKLPTKSGIVERLVVNWPVLLEQNISVSGLVSEEQFYSGFAQYFGSYEALSDSVKSKYINTVKFMNLQLARGI